MRAVNKCENIELNPSTEWQPMTVAKHEGRDVGRTYYHKHACGVLSTVSATHLRRPHEELGFAAFLNLKLCVLDMVELL